MSYINLPKNGEMLHILQQNKYFYKFCPSFVFMVQSFYITNLEKKLRFKELNNTPIMRMKMQGLCFFSLWFNLSCFRHLNFILSNVRLFPT
jgi:hypothetical protein